MVKQFSDGHAIRPEPGESLDDMLKRMKKNHTVVIAEEDRQLIIMALANLSMSRPGWDTALSKIAAAMDNVNEDHRPEMYDDFRTTWTSGVAARLAGEGRPVGEPLETIPLLGKEITERHKALRDALQSIAEGGCEAAASAIERDNRYAAFGFNPTTTNELPCRLHITGD